MESNRTIQDLITYMARYPTYSQAQIIARANAVSEHMLDTDIFNGIYSTVVTTPVNGFITVPRRWARAYGANIGTLDQNCSVPVRQGFAEFVEFGMGRQDPNKMCMTGLIDQGLQFCTQAEIWSAGVEESGTLRLAVANAADAGNVWRFNATFTDTDGVDRYVYDTSGTGGAGAMGFSLTSTGATIDTGFPIKNLQNIQAPAGLKGRYSLYKVINGTPNSIGTYDPDEVRPLYIRYKVRQPSAPGAVVTLFCKRQHVPYINVTDPIFPSLFEIYDFGFNAVTWRDKPDYKAMNEAWAMAERVLKAHINNILPPPRVTFSSDYPGSRGRLGMGNRPWR